MAIDLTNPTMKAAWEKMTDDGRAFLTKLDGWLDTLPDQQRDSAIDALSTVTEQSLATQSTNDTRTPAEVKFDLEQSGRLYTEEGQLEYKRAIARVFDNVFAAESDDQPAPPSERPLGTIAGCPVTGYHSDSPPYELYYASLTWNGLEISTDGETWINLGTGEAIEGLYELGTCGDMHLHEWDKIKALTQTDVVEQLIALMQQAKAP